MRAVDTTNGQLFVDLNANVEGEDGLRASPGSSFAKPAGSAQCWAVADFLRVSEPLVWSKFACRNEPPGLLMKMASWTPDTKAQDNKPAQETGG